MTKSGYVVWLLFLVAGATIWAGAEEPVSIAGNVFLVVALAIAMSRRAWPADSRSRRFSGFLILPAILSGIHRPYGPLDRVVMGAVVVAVVVLNSYLTFGRGESHAA